MAIHHQVLGQPGRDNALIVRIDSGKSVSRLLFDCGDGCLPDLSNSEIQSVDHLFFSHLHMDHIGGFDSFFRCTFSRDTKPNVIWGPPETSAILQHRFQGFWWNLHVGQPGTWIVNDIHPDRVERFRFEISEAFSHRHAGETAAAEPAILDAADFEVRAIPLGHNGPCIGYVVREKPRLNVQVERLTGLGLRPGPWMQALKDESTAGRVEIDGQSHDLEALRTQLLVETPGESIAYLTDFLPNEETCARLELELENCDTLVCEAQYRHDDIELAERNFHTTTTRVSELADRASVGKLVLFHLSDRYSKAEWLEMLEECRAIFPNTTFPDPWNETIQTTEG